MNIKIHFHKLGLYHLYQLLFLMLLTACTTTPDKIAGVSDPLEPLNRVTFAINDGVDKAVLKPTAKAYKKVVPEPIQVCISNTFGNIEDAFSSVNHLLQGKPDRAAMDLCRVAFNTVFGLGGCIDVASAMGIKKDATNFGDTLGKWKIGGGAYIVMPLMGSSTIRDAIGSGVQSTLDPISKINPAKVMYAIVATRTIDTRAKYLELEKTVDEIALDRYKFIRDAYLQRRYYQINGDYPPDSFPSEEENTKKTDQTTNATK